MSITPRQLQEIEARLSRPKGRPAPVLAPTQISARPPEIILGIDPSLRGTGWGVIQHGKQQSRALGYGVIVCPAGWPRSHCLRHIHQTIRQITAQHRPTHCAIEALFYAQNLQTALTLGEARGAALAAVAEAGLEIFEIAPRKAKQAIVGYGAARKEAVAKMIQRLLGLAELPPTDAADALALALTHAQQAPRHHLAPLKRI